MGSKHLRWVSILGTLQNCYSVLVIVAHNTNTTHLLICCLVCRNCFGFTMHGYFKFNVSWAHGFNESVMQDVTDAFVSVGLKDAGYEYINLDCGCVHR